MRGNAKVQIAKRKKEYGGDVYFIYIPVDVVRMLEIKAGDRVDFDIQNLGEDKFKRKTIPFKKKEEIKDMKDFDNPDVKIMKIAEAEQ